MKKFLYVVLLISILVTYTLAEVKPRKFKKYRKQKSSSEVADTNTRDVGKDEFKMMEEDDEKSAAVPPIVAGLDMIDNRVPIVDPCTQVHCGAGRVCEVDDVGEPHCVCIQTCPEEEDVRRKVCSNHNETWSSDCEVYQQRCLCDRGDPACRGEQYKHVHIEYYGQCRDMPECAKDEMADFPRRMRDWLFNIMRDLADRQELSPHFFKMEREAESNMTRRWTNAAIWKFCDLDGHPPDRSVSRHELFPIRAPLMALEHCISPFLNSCDADNNHRITIKEWAKCLELEEDDIEDKCEEIGEGLEEKN